MAEPPKYIQNAINYVGWKLTTGSTLSDAEAGLRGRYPGLSSEEVAFAVSRGQAATDLVEWANVAPEMASLRQTAPPGTEFGPEVEVTVRATVIDEHGNRRHHSEKVRVSPDEEIADIHNAAAAAIASQGSEYEDFEEADIVIDHIDFYPNPE